eukprot:1160884-Pelagomonas_calceolata.AAC.8
MEFGRNAARCLQILVAHAQLFLELLHPCIHVSKLQGMFMKGKCQINVHERKVSNQNLCAALTGAAASVRACEQAARSAQKQKGSQSEGVNACCIRTCLSAICMKQA